MRRTCLLIGVVAPFWVGAAVGQEEPFQKHLRLAEAAFLEGRTTEAVQHYKAAYALNPLARVQLNLGRSLVLDGQAAEGLETCQRFLHATPHAAEKELQKAHECIDQARALLPRRRPHPPRQPDPTPDPTPNPVIRKEQPSEGQSETPKVADPVTPTPDTKSAFLPPVRVPDSRPVPTPITRPTPIYRKGWFWAVVVVSAAAVTTAIAVPLAVHPSDPWLDTGVPADRRLMYLRGAP